jgi:catechol 2,3-dioxygenase-like lactoylglutathione lyase family enzyme
MSESTQRDENTQAAWPGGIRAITLFVEDLAAAKQFYRDVFQLPVFFEDDNSTVFKFGDTLVNLLEASEAPELVAPATVASPDAGVRFQFTLGVDDVDAMVEELKSRGVEVLNGPMDRPWGLRTASFRDPGGHIWEVAH